MANEYSGDYAISLPGVFPSIGEQIRDKQQRQDRLDEAELNRQERRDERDYSRNQQNRLYNLGQINQQTAFDKYKVGQQVIDNYTLRQLEGVKNKAITEYVNLDPAEMQYRLNQDLQPLFQWDAMAKQGYDNLEKTLTDLNKTYPNINLSDAHDIAMNKFAEDYMKQTPDGWTAKNPMEIKETDYQQMFNDPEVLGRITDDASGFGTYVQGLKTEPIGGKEVVDNKGKVHSYKWTGALSPFAETVNDESNRPFDKRVKRESVDLGGGKSIDVLPEDLYNTALQEPKARASFYSNWNKVQQQRELDFIQKFKQPITPRTQKLLMRQFAKEEIEKYDISNVKPEEIEKTPKPPSYTFNIGSADGINDVYKTIDDYVNFDLTKGNTATQINQLNTDAQNTIMDFVRKTTGNQNLNYGNVFLKKNEDGEIGVYKTSKGANGEKLVQANIHTLIGYLPRVGTNIKVQPGAGEKRAVIQEGNKTTPPPKKTKTDPLGIL